MTLRLKLKTSLLTLTAAAAALLSLGGEAHAADKTLCVYDPGGATGAAYKLTEKYVAAAQAWGVNFTMKAYTNEATAASDFTNGQCDAVLLTGVRTQEYNRKSYSIEAMGLTTSYDQLRTAVGVLAKPQAAPLMKSGAYETVGIYPAGAVYLYVQERANVDISALAGKKIATMSFDRAAPVMVSRVGATKVDADVGNFAQKFNNHSVWACYAPATAYGPLELKKGLGTTGGVIKFPLAQLTLQMLIRGDGYPAEFGQQSRQWAAQHFNDALALTNSAEAAIGRDGYWVELESARVTQYREMLKGVRADLVQQGAYDATVVQLVERISGQ